MIPKGMSFGWDIFHFSLVKDLQPKQKQCKITRVDLTDVHINILFLRYRYTTIEYYT